jgi:hypothetical protein
MHSPCCNARVVLRTRPYLGEAGSVSWPECVKCRLACDAPAYEIEGLREAVRAAFARPESERVKIPDHWLPRGHDIQWGEIKRTK